MHLRRRTRIFRDAGYFPLLLMREVDQGVAAVAAVAGVEVLPVEAVRAESEMQQQVVVLLPQEERLPRVEVVAALRTRQVHGRAAVVVVV